MIHTTFNVGDNVISLETGNVLIVIGITVDIFEHTHTIKYKLKTYDGCITLTEDCVGTPQEWYEHTIAKLCKASTEAATRLSILIKAIK